VEKEGAMAKIKKISLKPILILLQRTKKELKKGRKFAPAAQKKAFDARIRALGKAESFLKLSCRAGGGHGTGIPPLSIYVMSGR
jgi:hypothetical protein